MKKILTALALLFLTFITHSQEKTSSFFIGYGTQGFGLRGDFTISDDFIEGSQTRFYIEGGLNQQKFDEENFRFRSQNYPSDTRVIFAGIGISQEFKKNNFRIAPYLGFRYAYARFTDKALVDAIGQYNLIRYWNNQEVGPTVENGYGDAITIDAGVRLGYKITPGIELAFSAGISPIKFSTAATVYGKYWGESPYPNDYYIKYDIWRAEGGLRFHF